MLAEKVAAIPMTQARQRATFFRQSGWLMFASVGSGALMWGVHFLSKKIPVAEYRILGTLIALISCIPSIPLQMVFAQQAAADLAVHRESQLSGKIRLTWLGLFALWFIAAVIVVLAQSSILARWGIANPAALWVTIAVVLCSLWMPMFLGLLQGKQDFLWLGWAIIFNGVGRLGGAALIVVVLSGYAAGILTGVLIGLAAALLIGIWRSRDLWSVKSAPFDWRSFLGQVVPLMLGFGACQFIFTGDTMFANTYFPASTAFYVAAGTLSRGLVWVVGPITSVMFPKIVHSTAKAEKIDLLGLTLLCTGILAGGGAIALYLLGPFLVKIVWPATYLRPTMSLLPWYAAAMVPLSLANVLVNDLLARSRFRVVPILVFTAVLYGLTLTYAHSSPVAMLQILGTYNLVVLAICAWFTWGRKAPPAPSIRAAAM
jgi:O-antigen/teichoic acid export membrane protein